MEVKSETHKNTKFHIKRMSSFKVQKQFLFKLSMHDQLYI